MEVRTDRGRTLDRAIALETVVLVGITVVALAPGQRAVSENGSLDVALNTLAAVAAAGAAALAWIHYRIDAEASGVYESAAFIVQCISRAAIVGIAALGQSDELGMSVGSPQQWPLYAWSLARLVSASLLILAAEAAVRRSRGPRVRPWLLVLLPSIGLLMAILAIRAFEGVLPPFLGSSGMMALTGDTSVRPGMEPIGLVTQAIVGLLYLRGAQLYRRLYRSGGQGYAGWMTVALVVAAVSQVHWAFFPGIYRPVVTVDDALRAAFSVILLLGIEAQSRDDLTALRQANARLRGLRTADAERAALEAQARVAREVHDGVSQDLWIAKLKHARLAEVDLSPDARQLVGDVGEAVDRALAGARSVVETMGATAPPRSLRESIEGAVADFATRTGIRAELDQREPIGHVSAEASAEVLRIVTEALTNVLKHADATYVRVTVATVDDGRTVEVAVADNGRGFDPSSTAAGAFGLRGMRERAALIGGRLEVASRHADGTRVVLHVPATAVGSQ